MPPRSSLLLIASLLFLFASTASAEKKSKKAPTVAVLYLEYRGTDGELGFLRKGLSQMLVTDLSRSNALSIVERTNWGSVLKELKLGHSKHIQRSSANQNGKMLGAQFLITGGYFDFTQQLRVEAKIIDVERATTHSIGVEQSVDNFMQLETELAEQLEQQLLVQSKIHSNRTKQRTRTGQGAKEPICRQKCCSLW